MTYWSTLCEFLREQGSEGVALAEDLVPSTFVFSQYMERYFQESVVQLQLPIVVCLRVRAFVCVRALVYERLNHMRRSYLPTPNSTS